MSRPLRVLHLHSTFHRGGIETFIAGALQRMDPARIRCDVAAFALSGGRHEQRFRELGCDLYELGLARRPVSYMRRLAEVIRAHGPYDVLHSHLHHYSGFALPVAARAGVRARVAHSHFDTRHRQHGPRSIYYRWMKRRIARHATAGLATSRAAAADLFGANWEDDPRWRVLYAGIELEPFREPVDVAEVRASLGIPSDAFVLGHVGRISHQKNQPFLIRVAAELARRGETAWLVVVGEGPERPELEALARELGIGERTVFTGMRRDVARLLRAMDLMLLPSRYEGLGLVVVEALAAGVPCVVSEAVPDDAAVIPSLVERLGFDASHACWADAVLRMKALPAAERLRALDRVSASPFNPDTAARQLLQIYAEAAGD